MQSGNLAVSLERKRPVMMTKLREWLADLIAPKRDERDKLVERVVAQTECASESVQRRVAELKRSRDPFGELLASMKKSGHVNGHARR